MPLTDAGIRNAKPSHKTKRMFDGGGLYLEIAPSGGKWWRLKFRYGGKEKRLSLGVYPDVSLKEARERRDEARKLLANDIDPSQRRRDRKAAKEDRAVNSFELVAREWFAKWMPNKSANHADRTIRRLERDIFPLIGEKPIADITPQQLLGVVRRIEEREAVETAHRALGNCRQIFRHAVVTGRVKFNPTQDLREALQPVKSNHFAAVTEPKKVGELLRVIEGYKGTPTVCCGLRFAPLVFSRPGELRKAEWEDINLDNGEWCYTATKTDTKHIVPLSKQAVAILRELHPLTGRGRYVFPGARSAARPMSENAILAAMRKMEIPKEEMSGHGFRAMARTILDEVLGFRPDIIEHQLGHAVRDPNGRAYNRTAHLPERRKMMQEWADYLDKLKAGGEVIPINRSV